MFKAKTLWESFSKRGKITPNTFFKNGSVNSGWGVKRGWFFLFVKIFSKGFCFERLFRFLVIQKTFSNGFCFERLLQKKSRLLCFEKSRVTSRDPKELKLVISAKFHRFSMVLETVLIGFEPILRRQSDFCHCTENSFVRTAS